MPNYKGPDTNVNVNNEAIISAAKEAARVAVLAAVGFLLAYVAELPETTTTAIVLVLLRGLDKYLFKSGKAAKGLTQF